MKPWQWALLAGAALVVIIIISRESATPVNGQLNAEVQATAGIGGLLGGLLRGSTTKVGASSAVGSNSLPPGSVSYDTPAGSSDYGPTSASSGAAYSAAMAGSAGAASQSAGTGGTNAGGGLTGAQASNSQGDPLGLGTLTSPSFDVGTGGADFSN